MIGLASLSMGARLRDHRIPSRNQKWKIKEAYLSERHQFRANPGVRPDKKIVVCLQINMNR
jgi:hypothetical protein